MKRYEWRYEWQGDGTMFDKRGRALKSDVSYTDRKTGETVVIFMTPQCFAMAHGQRKLPTLCNCECQAPKEVNRLPLRRSDRGVLSIERERPSP